MHLKKYIIGQHCRMLKQCSTIKKLFVLHSIFILYVNMQYFLEREDSSEGSNHKQKFQICIDKFK